MNKLAALLIVIILIPSCSTKKATTTSQNRPAPSWTQSKPVDPNYYHGIGVSSKNLGNQANLDYKQIAKNNALNDLASEISVRVNATSLLSQVEVNRHLSESFIANTYLMSTEDLEGYELVDTYENDTHYFVFYRLSRELHERRKALRREKALESAADLLSSAEEFRNRKDGYQSFILYIKSIEAIKEFWNEPLETTFQGNKIFFGNYLFSRIIGFLNELQIQAYSNTITATRGRPIEPEQLEIFVTLNGIRQPSIPLRLTFTGGRLRNPNVKTNSSGAIFPDIGRITSTNPRERLSAVINLEAWTSEATSDYKILQLMNQIRLRPFSIDIIVQSPSFALISDERMFGASMNSTPLSDALKSELIKDQFVVYTNGPESDFKIWLEADVEDTGQISKMSSASLSFRIQITDKDGHILYNRIVKSVKGIHADARGAAIDAYNKAARLIQRELYLEIRRPFIE